MNNVSVHAFGQFSIVANLSTSLKLCNALHWITFWLLFQQMFHEVTHFLVLHCTVMLELLSDFRRKLLLSFWKAFLSHDVATRTGVVGWSQPGMADSGCLAMHIDLIGKCEAHWSVIWKSAKREHSCTVIGCSAKGFILHNFYWQ